MKSSAQTVTQYMASLPPERQKPLSVLRRVIKSSLPGASESMLYGMPTYSRGGPICAFASQKNFMAFYICDPALLKRHRKQLGKLNCGKGCIRFRTIQELPPEVMADILKDVADSVETPAR